MARQPRILTFLQSTDDASADAAMAAALHHADPALQLKLVRALLARARPAGVGILAEQFDRLDHAARHQIASCTAQLVKALRTTIRSPNSQTRLNTLRIIRESGDVRFAYLAALALRDGAARVRGEAAQVMQHLAERYARDRTQTTKVLQDSIESDSRLARAASATVQMLGEERRLLLSALRDALNSFGSHHRTEVLSAAMHFAEDLEDALFQRNTLARGKLTHAMLEVLGGTLSPSFAMFVYVALNHAELRRRITDLVASCRDTDFFIAFLRGHWMAHDPAIRKNLAQVRALDWFGEGFEPAFTLPPDAAALAPTWLVHLGIPTDQKTAILLNFLLIDNPAANRAALWALIRIDTPASTLALQSVVDHEDDGIRRMAELEIAHRNRRDERRMYSPRRGRTAEWSQMLSRAGLDEQFQDLWQHFDRLQPEQAKAAGHHALEYIEGFSTQVQTKLLSPHAADRLRGLRFIEMLHVAGRFDRDVFSLANDPLPEIRAAAARALVHIADPTSRRILERALSDESPSVQAAAIEGLEALRALRDPEALLPKAESDDSEVRSAAIRALLRLRIPKAAIALVTMLRDSRVEHRCAALWIIEQLRLSAIAPRLREMILAERDPRVARTAQQVLRRLERHSETAARSAAAPVASGDPAGRAAAPDAMPTGAQR